MSMNLISIDLTITHDHKNDSATSIKVEKITKPLHNLIDEYLLTIDNEDKNETYCTDRELNESILAGFMEWLNKYKL